MAHGKFLTDEEKIKINIHNENGCNVSEIARKINRSIKVVRNYLKLGLKYGIRKKTKGNSKLTKRQIGQIKDEATKNHLNSSQIVNKLCLPVTKQHVAKILRSLPGVKWKKMKSKPRLTATHKQKRLQFARDHIHWKQEWKKVIFSDEKKFNLDGPDCYSCYWHNLNTTEVTRSKRNFGGGSVMVWGAFYDNGKLPICFVSGRMNSQYYINLLEEVLITFLDENNEEQLIFQQDNASIHASRQTKRWFEENNIEVLSWPPCSPDLNPIENLWGILASKVYANNTQYNTVTELKIAIKDAWAEIEATCLNSLIGSMFNRVFEVTKNRGGHTKY